MDPLGWSLLQGPGQEGGVILAALGKGDEVRASAGSHRPAETLNPGTGSEEERLFPRGSVSGGRQREATASPRRVLSQEP